MHPLYWVPAELHNTFSRPAFVEIMRKHGLGYLLDGDRRTDIEWRGTTQGPPGSTTGGTVFRLWPAGADQTTQETLGLHLDSQDWASEDNGSGAYAGRWRGKPVCPSDLARPAMVHGHMVDLEDGQEWMIPLARVFPQGTMLPKILYRSNDGTMMGKVRREYLSLCITADEVFRSLMDASREGEQGLIDMGKLLDAVTMALGVNYRLSSYEVGFLEILGTQSIIDAAWALVDRPAIEKAIADMEKKTA